MMTRSLLLLCISFVASAQAQFKDKSYYNHHSFYDGFDNAYRSGSRSSSPPVQQSPLYLKKLPGQRAKSLFETLNAQREDHAHSRGRGQPSSTIPSYSPVQTTLGNSRVNGGLGEGVIISQGGQYYVGAGGVQRRGPSAPSDPHFVAPPPEYGYGNSENAGTFRNPIQSYPKDFLHPFDRQRGLQHLPFGQAYPAEAQIAGPRYGPWRSHAPQHNTVSRQHPQRSITYNVGTSHGVGSYSRAMPHGRNNLKLQSDVKIPVRERRPEKSFSRGYYTTMAPRNYPSNSYGTPTRHGYNPHNTRLKFTIQSSSSGHHMIPTRRV